MLWYRQKNLMELLNKSYYISIAVYCYSSNYSLKEIFHCKSFYFRFLDPFFYVAYDAYRLSSNFSKAISVKVASKDHDEPGDPGERTSHTAGEVVFFMRLAPASTFPTGIDDDGEATMDHSF